jgi:hypothetical protein
LDGTPFLPIGLLGGGLSTSSSESEFDDSEFQVFDLCDDLFVTTFRLPLSLESLSAAFSLSGSFLERPDRRIP